MLAACPNHRGSPPRTPAPSDVAIVCQVGGGGEGSGGGVSWEWGALDVKRAKQTLGGSKDLMLR